MASSPVSDGSEIFTSPRDDDEQGVARVADVEDDLAAPEAPRAHARREPLEGVRVEPGEERDRRERLEDGPAEPACRAHRSALSRTSSGCPVADSAGVARRRHRDPGRTPYACRAMSVDPPGRLRLTVLGCSTAVPHPDVARRRATSSNGTTTAVLLDVGQGVVRRLAARCSIRATLAAVVVGHMHADHYLDLVGLRYLYPWGERRRDPPAGPPAARRARAARCPGDRRSRSGRRSSTPRSTIAEYDPDDAAPGRRPDASGSCRGRHYVPAWGVVVEAPDGTRLAYTGDTGPTDAVVDFARGADLLLVEAALREHRRRRPRARPPDRRRGGRPRAPRRGAGRSARPLRPRPPRPSSRHCATRPAHGSDRPSPA